MNGFVDYHARGLALLAYTLTAALFLWLACRFVRPLSRRAAMLLFLIPFAFCGFALLSNRVYAPVDLPYATAPMKAMKTEYGVTKESTGMHTDVYTEFIPWRRSVQWSLRRGEWGLRNPFAMSGDILLGSQQAAVVSPLTLIAALMPVALSFTFTAAITFFIAALCAFLLARELGCSEAASLVAGAGWAFCTPIALFLLVTMGETWAWCPLLLVAVRRVVELPSTRSAALLAFAFSAILFSGHPESAVLCVLVGMLYGAFEMTGRARGAGRRQQELDGSVSAPGPLLPATSLLRPALFASGAAIVALLLSAIHLLPFLEALPYSVEHHMRSLNFVDAPGTTPLKWSVARIATTLLPYLHERHWNVAGFRPAQMLELEIGAVGSLILALAVFGFLRTRTAASWFFGALGLFSLLVHAEWSPLITVMRFIPVLEETLLDRLAFSFALSMCILAAMGVDRLRTRGAALTLGAMFVLIAAGNWWVTRTPLVVHGPLKFGEYKVAAEVAGLALATVIAAARPRIAPALLLGLVLGQRVLSDGGLYHSFTQRQAYPPVPLFAALKNVREPFRIVATGNLFIPQTATMYELEDVRGVPSLTLRGYAETYSLWCTPQPVWFQRVDDLTRPFLSFLNVRYAISDKPAPPGWREVARDRGTFLHENTRVFPRAFIPRSVSVGYPRLWNLGDILKETDFAARAWIEAPGAQYVRENGPGTLAIHNARLGYTIDADMAGEGWIVTSIPAWPGWRATIDGRDAETRIANHSFVSVLLPRGKHAVRLTYWPRSFVWGRAISAATLLGIIGFAISRASGASRGAAGA